jgi:hypothetical protein
MITSVTEEKIALAPFAAIDGPPVTWRPGPQPWNRIAGTADEQLRRARRGRRRRRPLTRRQLLRLLDRRDAEIREVFAAIWDKIGGRG